MANKKARVLVDTQIGEESFKPNDVINADEKTISALEKQGTVDSNADAVAYAETLKPAKAKKAAAQSEG